MVSRMLRVNCVKFRKQLHTVFMASLNLTLGEILAASRSATFALAYPPLPRGTNTSLYKGRCEPRLWEKYKFLEPPDRKKPSSPKKIEDIKIDLNGMKLQPGVQYKDPAESGIDNRSAGNFENNSIASELVNLEVSIAKRNNDSKLNSVEDNLAPDEVRFRF
ncbi:hypothetical protein L2E82_01877 [Cichorium intybus]|uniref:Uncharacterized protein n=1 Tax=Cichorium intybus TaxID=13427 RepID=A0ACB9H047_CICIN|nr:hypothetical protein L2E82_01877 [Cichorium intybus]